MVHLKKEVKEEFYLSKEKNTVLNSICVLMVILW